jgi:predicted amidohydrolase
VCLAQVDPALGDVEANVRRSREAVERARAEGADLVVLPELMLTGYSLGRVSDDLSLSVDDREIAELAEASDGLASVVGFAEAGLVHTYNSAAYL